MVIHRYIFRHEISVMLDYYQFRKEKVVQTQYETVIVTIIIIESMQIERVFCM